jgi:cytochrome c oxidase assembly protein subunit 15
MIPTTLEEWESEFEEFKKFPEYQMKRKYENFGLEEFKFIYFMEWAHRMAGR